MKKKSHRPDFNQTVELLCARGFVAAPWPSIPGAVLVSKNHCAAVLAPSASGAAEMAVQPGALIGGEIARLVDRGYQKFLKTSKYELPATAAQLQAIHAFTEELKDLTCGISLYNESLGTTSDRYLYDRLQGREATQLQSPRPWDLGDPAAGH